MIDQTIAAITGCGVLHDNKFFPLLTVWSQLLYGILAMLHVFLFRGSRDEYKSHPVTSSASYSLCKLFAIPHLVPMYFRRINLLAWGINNTAVLSLGKNYWTRRFVSIFSTTRRSTYQNVGKISCLLPGAGEIKRQAWWALTPFAIRADWHFFLNKSATDLDTTANTEWHDTSKQDSKTRGHLCENWNQDNKNINQRAILAILPK